MIYHTWGAYWHSGFLFALSLYALKNAVRTPVSFLLNLYRLEEISYLFRQSVERGVNRIEVGNGSCLQQVYLIHNIRKIGGFVIMYIADAQPVQREKCEGTGVL